MRKNWLLGLFLAVLLVGVSACGGSSEGDGGEAAPSAEASAEASPGEGADPSAPEPDLEDVPEVVAEVNGEEIPRDEFVEVYEAQFQQAMAQSQAAGQEVDQDQLKKQVADSLVSTELLVQEADERGIEVSDKDVDQTLKSLAQQNGVGSVEEFLTALEGQGMDAEEVDRQVRTQVRIERLVADEAGDLSVSQKEARALYEQLVAQQEQAGQQGGQAQEMPPFKQVRPQLEEQVKAQKESEVAQRLVGDLRKKGDVVVNL